MCGNKVAHAQRSYILYIRRPRILKKLNHDYPEPVHLAEENRCGTRQMQINYISALPP